MKTKPDSWLEVADAFHAAAFGNAAWSAALDGLASATGSSHGGLLTFGNARTVDMNLMTGADEGFADDYQKHGGGDPETNPRLRAALGVPLLDPFGEPDFASPRVIANEPFYQEFLIPNDMPHLCAAIIERDATSMTGVCIVRTAGEGAPSVEQRALFATVAPHVRNAFRTQIALRDEGFRLIAGALGQLSVAGFVCDEHRRVRATTPLGEAIASEESVLRIRRGYLSPVRHADVEEFSTALRAVAHCREMPALPFARSLIVHDKEDRPSVIDVIALPVTPGALASSPHVLVLARDHAQRRRASDVEDTRTLQAAYRLAPAEAKIALGIASGLTVEEIARGRGVAVATVRVQLRTVFEKMGIRRQADLIILVNRLR